MVKFKVKANPQGQYYFPKEVREELGEKLELICNAKAAIVYSYETRLETILESLEIIKKDLKHRLRIRKEHEK